MPDENTPDTGARQVAVVLSADELEFVKDALWYASRAEQIAMSDDLLFRESFLSELRAMSERREAEGKPGFQDLFLGLTGVPADELGREARQRLGIIALEPDEAAAESPSEEPVEELVGLPVSPATELGPIARVLRGLRGFVFRE